MCRGCSTAEKMRRNPERTKANALKASIAAKQIALTRVNPYEAKFGRDVVATVRLRMTSAKGRCHNPNSASYRDYGGRGIKFKFPTPLLAAYWILDNLGPPPSGQHSIDRIDNNRHYEPGNLRWATSEEQARNKRQYKRTQEGEIIRQVLAVRSDLSYETVRIWIKAGMVETEILGRKKYASSSV